MKQLHVTIGVLLVLATACQSDKPKQTKAAPASARAAAVAEAKKATLEAAYDSMKARAHVDPGAQGAAFGYYFTGADTTKLHALADALAPRGFRVVNIRKDEGGAFYWLHLEKVEKLGPEALNARNKEFARLALQHGLGYDGWQMGRPRR